MDYVQKVSGTTKDVSDKSRSARREESKSSLEVPAKDRTNLSPVNEMLEGTPSSESVSSNEYNEVSNTLSPKDLSQVKSPSKKREGDKPNYDTYDIKEESAVTTSMDGAVRVAVLTHHAKNKFLKMLDPKPKPYEPIYNKYAHPYKNLRRDDENDGGDNKPSFSENKMPEKEAEEAEDPEADGYEPTNMLRELVLLKSAGFDLNDDKVKQFIDLKNELDDNDDESKSDKSDEAKDKDSAKNQDAKKEMKKTAQQNATEEQKDKTKKGDDQDHEKTVAEKDNNNAVSGKNKDNIDAEVEKLTTKNTPEKDVIAKDALAQQEDNFKHSENKDGNEPNINGKDGDMADCTASTEHPTHHSVAQTISENNTATSKPNGSNQDLPSQNGDQEKVLLERHVSFSDEPPNVLNAGATGRDEGGRQTTSVNDETDEPVFVVSSFDTFLQQLYVNMGMFLCVVYLISFKYWRVFILGLLFM